MTPPLGDPCSTPMPRSPGNAPRPGDFREASLDVIRPCRRTHEVFATYTGVFLTDPAAGRSLLAGRPEYLAYYDDACFLAAGITDGTQLQWYAVISAIRACMQSHGLPEALSIGLGPLPAIPPAGA